MPHLPVHQIAQSPLHRSAVNYPVSPATPIMEHRILPGYAGHPPSPAYNVHNHHPLAHHPQVLSHPGHPVLHHAHKPELEGIENCLRIRCDHFNLTAPDQVKVMGFISRLVAIGNVTHDAVGVGPGELEIIAEGKTLWSLARDGSSDLALEDLRRRLYSVKTHLENMGTMHPGSLHNGPPLSPFH